MPVNPSTWEAEAGGSPFKTSLGYNNETLVQKTKQGHQKLIPKTLLTQVSVPNLSVKFHFIAVT